MASMVALSTITRIATGGSGFSGSGPRLLLFFASATRCSHSVSSRSYSRFSRRYRRSFLASMASIGAKAIAAPTDFFEPDSPTVAVQRIAGTRHESFNFNWRDMPIAAVAAASAGITM